MSEANQALAVLISLTIVTIIGFISTFDILRKWSEERDNNQLWYAFITVIGTIVLDFVIYSFLP